MFAVVQDASFLCQACIKIPPTQASWTLQTKTLDANPKPTATPTPQNFGAGAVRLVHADHVGAGTSDLPDRLREPLLEGSAAKSLYQGPHKPSKT